MTPATPRVITEELGGSPLSLAAQSGRLPHALFAGWPSDRDEWMVHAQRVRRGRGAHWYPAVAAAIAPRGAAERRLEKVVAENGIVVTTGQQAGLFGGPLYTMAKAVSALALADELEQQLGIATAPVFWAATDDADFLEASRTWVADADGLAELVMSQRPPSGTPMSATPLGDVEALLAALRKASGSAAHGQYLEAAREAYTQRRTVGDAYVTLLRGVLEPLGVAVLDSSHPGYLAAARPILLEAAHRATEVAAAVSERTVAIRALGYEPQVDDERGLSLVAITEAGVKRRLPIDEARAITARGSAPLGANVLLRPVVECAVLPTVAYVAGPAELAYFAQSSAVAKALGRERPTAIPRWSCTVIESFAAHALDRLRIDFREARDVRALERRFAATALPADVSAAWKALKDVIQRSMAGLDAAVRASALLPPAVIEGLEHSMKHRLDRAERRLLAAAKRKDAQNQHDIAIVGAALFPLGKRQERVLNFIPMLTRGGPDLVTEMHDAARTQMRLFVGATAAAATTR